MRWFGVLKRLEILFPLLTRLKHYRFIERPQETRGRLLDRAKASGEGENRDQDMGTHGTITNNSTGRKRRQDWIREVSVHVPTGRYGWARTEPRNSGRSSRCLQIPIPRHFRLVAWDFAGMRWLLNSVAPKGSSSNSNPTKIRLVCRLSPIPSLCRPISTTIAKKANIMSSINSPANNPSDSDQVYDLVVVGSGFAVSLAN